MEIHDGNTIVCYICEKEKQTPYRRVTVMDNGKRKSENVCVQCDDRVRSIRQYSY